MAMIRKTRAAGKRPPKEVIDRVKRLAKEARKSPPDYMDDCPESTSEALVEFAAAARKLRQKKKKPMVAIRVENDTLDAFKKLGKGYTGIMSDVLDYAAKNPEILTQALK